MTPVARTLKGQSYFVQQGQVSRALKDQTAVAFPEWEVIIDIDDPDVVMLCVGDDLKPIPIVKGENRIEFREY